MRQAWSFLLVGLTVTIAGGPVLSGCSGAEFGFIDSNLRDGAGDTQIPTNDRNASDGVGGRGGTGAGGSGGTGSGASGGTGGTGAGGSGGTGAGGGDDAGVDDGSDDDGTGTSDDAASDVSPDASDGHTDRGDADAGRSGDVTDAPTDSSTDAKDGDADTDSRSDASISDARDSSSDLVCGEPVVYYRDEDGDGFGTNNTVTYSCVAPGNGWSGMGGDCRDDLPAVKPFQSGWPNPPQYSDTGYADPAKPQGISFDYDCNGAETADPSNAFGPVPNCGGLLNCDGAGYLPVNPARTGPGIDPRCGSTTIQRCNGKLLSACALLPPQSTSTPYRCR